jgi:hypothetical protein
VPRHRRHDDPEGRSTRRQLDILREQGGGRIIQVSSLGGRIGSPGMTAGPPTTTKPQAPGSGSEAAVSPACTPDRSHEDDQPHVAVAADAGKHISSAHRRSGQAAGVGLTT